MDAADREPRGHGHGHGHGHRIEASLLPLKKRASNYSSSAGRISAGDPYSSSSKKAKKRVDDDSVVVGAETKHTAGAFLEAPVPRQRRRPVPAAASSRELAAEQHPAPAAGSPPEPAAKGKAAALLSESDEEKKRWLSKGKWQAAKDEEKKLTPPVKKLMHDGIRSFIPHHLRDDDEYRRHTAAAAAAVPPPSHHGRSSSQPALSAALERRLEKLGATRPWLVLRKTLQKSDVDANQNRLLVSCKRGGSGTESCPITRCFSRAELDRVHNKHAGLCVTALDRDGNPYDLTCKFLASNNGYRFITEWKKFVTQNGMNLDDQRHKVWNRDVEVELWAFRSRKLPFQPRLVADVDGKVVVEKFKDEGGSEVTVVQRISHHLDPDGALGLLLLHHENTRRRVVKSEEEEEEDDDWKQGPSLSLPPSTVARKKKTGKQQSGKRGASASASPAPVALPAPVAEQGGARPSEELLFCAALGLLKLRQSIKKQWQERVDRGGHGGAKGLSNDVAKKSSADVEGEKTDKKQQSPGTHRIKELGASSQSVDSLGGNMPLGSNGGRKTSTEDMAQAKV